VLGKELLLVGGLFLAAADVSRAQAVPPDTASHAPSTREGSWSAATGSGLTLLGTWTAILDPTGTVTGMWTLVDAQGNARADGAWSAAKSPQGWTGAWRSVMSGREGEYSGTWTAAVEGKPDARLADLFEKAMQNVISGTWGVNGRSGGWSIRTFK
jgi:hypothetical protein